MSTANPNPNPAPGPDYQEAFITVQISGHPRSVDVMREALLDEINLTVKFCSAMMNKRKPVVKVFESQVA